MHPDCIDGPEHVSPVRSPPHTPAPVAKADLRAHLPAIHQARSHVLAAMGPRGVEPHRQPTRLWRPPAAQDAQRLVG